MSSLALTVGGDLSVSLQRVKRGHCFKSAGIIIAHLVNYLSTCRILLTLMFFLDNLVTPALLNPLKHNAIVYSPWKNQRNCKRRRSFCLSLKALEKWEWLPAISITVWSLALLLSSCGSGMASRKGDRGEPATTISISQCCKCSPVPPPAAGTYQPCFVLSLRDGTYFRLEHLSVMKPSIACFLHERLIPIYVKELLSANLYTT